MYCCVLKETIFKIALTVQLPNWLKTNKCTKQPYVSQAIKFVITVKFLGVQIDNNLT